MEIHPQSSTTVCAHCERDIPTSNIDLHFAHCSRNLERCTLCGDMIPKKHAGEHYDNNHAPVDCSLCSKTMQREVLDFHKGEECSQRIVTCEYCEFPLPAVDLSKHQEVCGNRTEYCDACNKYIRLRERVNHDIEFHSSSNGPAESSRYIIAVASEDTNLLGLLQFYSYMTHLSLILMFVESLIFLLLQSILTRKQRNGNIHGREERNRRRPGHDVSKRRVLLTIAITGIAVLLGSIFFQKRADAHQQQ